MSLAILLFSFHVNYSIRQRVRGDRRDVQAFIPHVRVVYTKRVIPIFLILLTPPRIVESQETEQAKSEIYTRGKKKLSFLRRLVVS